MSQTIAVGDFITDYSGIYRVINLETGTDHRGENCSLLYYEPVWGTDKKYTASIPVENLSQSGLRSVITKKDVKMILEGLSDADMASEFVSNEAKEVVYQNDTRKVVMLLKYMWVNQETIKKADKVLMEQMLENLSREIAFVTKSKFGKVKQDLTGYLNKIRQ